MKKKIPKVIHYCWFSGEPLIPMAEKCISSWKKYCPDYQIVQWNADNFDIHINDFVWEAYQAKKWAFVTDFARLYILYHYGGIYMDSDVEVVRNLDYFLKTPAFMGMETDEHISAGIIGAGKGNECIKVFLDYYEGRHFRKKNGDYNQVTNTVIITNNIRETYGIKLDGKFTRIKDSLAIYPKDVFSPKNYATKRIEQTNRTYTIHHFNGSWIDNKEKCLRRFVIGIESIFGQGCLDGIIKL